MKRSPPPARRAPLPRSKRRIKTRYRTRGGRHSDPKKLAWLRTLGCWAREVPWDTGPFACVGFIEAHHVRVRGSRATDRLTIPLCTRHHRVGEDSLENLGREEFERRHGDMMDAARRYETEWQVRKASQAAWRQAGTA